MRAEVFNFLLGLFVGAVMAAWLLTGPL
jgi:hypothetical protein